MIKYYKFAEITIRIEMPDDMEYPENMDLFEYRPASSLNGEEAPSEDMQVDFSYKLRFVKDRKELAPVQERWINETRYERSNMSVHVKGDLECRLIYFEGSKIPYAVSEEISARETEVYVFPEERAMLRYDNVFASLFSFERKFLTKNTLILHCAYMEREGEAILFSAPSGTGKSTQADLWEQYRHTRTINGDDALLTVRDGRWYAHGWSVCGSSEICHNESYPIRAIVMLYQDKENSCRELSLFDAFRNLYPQIKVNMWNEAFQNQVCDLVDDLMEKVQVLELGCDISEGAVACLENILK